MLIDTELRTKLTVYGMLVKIGPFLFTITAIILSLILFEYMSKSILQTKLSNLGYYIFGFFSQRFLIEFFYNEYIVKNILFLGGQTTKILDKGSIELIGPYGLHSILVKTSKIISNLSQSIVTDYALYFVIGTCFYLSIFMFILLSYDSTNSIIISSLIILIYIVGFKNNLEKNYK
jgi:NADH-ubiquinone oxidoreductase chain 5